MGNIRTWLYVLQGPMGPQFVLYNDDPPTKQALTHLPKVLHRWEITGTPWVNRSLNEIEDEYRRRVARGDLPPDDVGRAKART